MVVPMGCIIAFKCFSPVFGFVVRDIHYIYNIFILCIGIDFRIIPSALSKGTAVIYMTPCRSTILRMVNTSFFFIFYYRPYFLGINGRNCNPYYSKSSLSKACIEAYFFPCYTFICTFPKCRSFTSTI